MARPLSPQEATAMILSHRLRQSSSSKSASAQAKANKARRGRPGRPPRAAEDDTGTR